MAKHRPAVFPVAEHQLPNIHISPEQHEELRAYVTQMTQEIVHEGPTWGRNVAAAQEDGWKLATSTLESCFLTKSNGKSSSGSSYSTSSKTRGKQQRAHGTMHTPPTSGQCFMGCSKVPYTLEDVMNSVYCENTKEVRLHFANTYGSACLDSCALATLEGATLEDPFWYIGIKWIALKSPVKKLVSSREFVFIEHTGTHVTSDGQRMLYRIVQSINICGYGGKDSYFGLTRGHIEAAFVFWVDEKWSTAEKPVLNMSTKGRTHMKGNLPLWITQFYLKRFWTAERTLHHDEALQEPSAHIAVSTGNIATLGSAPLDMATEWVPNDERTACYVCHKKFQLVRRPKHHCRSCGEVICSDCTSYSQLNVGPLQRKMSGNALRSQVRSQESMETAHRRQSKRRGRQHSRDPTVAYTTMGKVCHRCMDLKTIMHNNSTNLESSRSSLGERGNQIVVWKNEYTSIFEELRTLTPERDSRGKPRVIELGDPDVLEEKPSSSENSSGGLGANIIAVGPRRESSLTSSEVRAIIEQQSDELKSDGVETEASAVVHGGYGGGEEEDGEFENGEDLEYHPVLAHTVPAHELPVHHGDPHRGVSTGSLSGFNPDHLFDFQNNFSDDEDDDDDSDDDRVDGAHGGERVVFSERGSSLQNEVLYRELLATTLSPPMSPLSSAASIIESPTAFEKKQRNTRILLSPTNSPTSSTTLSNSSWSRSQTGNISITDVRSAIADQAKLLDELKRGLDAEVP